MLRIIVRSRKRTLFFFFSVLSMAEGKEYSGSNILLYTFLASVQNIKKSSKTKEVGIKKLITASANGNSTLVVKILMNENFIYEDIEVNSFIMLYTSFLL